MTVSTAWRDDFGIDDLERVTGNGRSQQRLAGAALSVIVVACAWVLWTDLQGFRPSRPVAEGWNATAVLRPTPGPAAVAAAYAKLAQALSHAARRSKVARALADADRIFFDAHYLGLPGEIFAEAPLVAAYNEAPATGSAPAAVASTPVASNASSATDRPRGRPQTPAVLLGSMTHANRTATRAPAEQPSIFERLFGKPAPFTLAYAAPEDGVGGGPEVTAPPYDRWTAVYDISAHTVYLPDGSKLEAHSGFGRLLDDPRYTNEKMRGATPAAVYDLRLRQGLFHGVQALRLIPTDEARVFGRTGLLAHTFMLGPNGQSNGCVSFRNYYAFLQAYLSGEIKRLAVVARLD